MRQPIYIFFLQQSLNCVYYAEISHQFVIELNFNYCTCSNLLHLLLDKVGAELNVCRCLPGLCTDTSVSIPTHVSNTLPHGGTACLFLSRALKQVVKKFNIH